MGLHIASGTGKRIPGLSINTAYADVAEHDGLVDDPAQRELLAIFENLQGRLLLQHRSWRKRLRRLGLPFVPAGQPVRGLYLWGGVGRGKTLLMDLFFESLAIDRKKRIHFHRMMSEVHARLASYGEIEDPVDAVAADIAASTAVLCFDEFYVSDIGDAMILGRLLDGLFRRRVTLIATSNSQPSDLYAGGLQRERFLPAIAALERYMQVMHMGGDADHRLRILQQAGTYLHPADQLARSKLQQFFGEIAPGPGVANHELDILGRLIRTERCAKGVAWFDFQQICDGPRSQQDYIEIARSFQTVIVAQVPVLEADREDAARRFVAMVDEFYDRKVKLILSADAPLDALYRGKRLELEFRRTRSRLTEMQSTDYLHTAHLA